MLQIPPIIDKISIIGGIIMNELLAGLGVAVQVLANQKMTQ